MNPGCLLTHSLPPSDFVCTEPFLSSGETKFSKLIVADDSLAVPSIPDSRKLTEENDD